MIYTGLHRYDDALSLFMHGVTSPTQVMNHITICMFKKLVLVSMLGKHRAMVALPKYTSQIVARGVRSACVEYLALEKPFVDGNLEGLTSVMHGHEKIFKRDGNWGLVNMLTKALITSSIQKLTQTYVTFPMSDIAEKVKLPSKVDAERYVLAMIEGGDRFATINQKDGMLEFIEDMEQYNGVETIRKLDKDMRMMMHLNEKVNAIDEAIMCDQAYLDSKLSSIGGFVRRAAIDFSSDQHR